MRSLSLLLGAIALMLTIVFQAPSALAQDATSAVYETGPFTVRILDFSKSGGAVATRPPVTTRVFAPDQAGTYPLVLWFSCFMCSVDFQEELLSHIASHGFVVVTAELHTIPEIATTQQLSTQDKIRAVALFAWLRANLATRLFAPLKHNVQADFGNVGVVGYSSGAKVAWPLALEALLPISAMAGLMPVDNQGDPFGLMPEPSILEEPFELEVPTLVLGTGHDPVPRRRGMPACGPAGHNHEQFYELSSSPAYHVVGLNNGHMDVLDKDMEWMASLVCPTNRPKHEMRSLAKGMLSAFLRASLRGDDELWDVLQDVELAPTAITATSK